MTHMETTYRNGFPQSEREFYRLTIYKNVISSAKSLIQAKEQFEIQLENEVNRECCSFLMGHSTIDLDHEKPLEASVGQALRSIWHDPGVQKVMERRSEFHLSYHS